jgi:hypothetical protein
MGKEASVRERIGALLTFVMSLTAIVNIGTSTWPTAGKRFRNSVGCLRPPAPIAGLSEFEQVVFRFRYHVGLNVSECFHRLESDYPGLTEQQVSEAIGRIHNSLSPAQRWRLNAQIGRQSMRSGSRGEDVAQLVHPGSAPEEQTHRKQQALILKPSCHN